MSETYITDDFNQFGGAEDKRRDAAELAQSIDLIRLARMWREVASLKLKDGDLYTLLACFYYELPPSAITPEQREDMKRSTYAVAHGRIVRS